MPKWKITYIDFSGVLRSFEFTGELYNFGNVIPPNGGSNTILKIEKIETEIPVIS